MLPYALPRGIRLCDCCGGRCGERCAVPVPRWGLLSSRRVTHMSTGLTTVIRHRLTVVCVDRWFGGAVECGGVTVKSNRMNQWQLQNTS